MTVKYHTHGFGLVMTSLGWFRTGPQKTGLEWSQSQSYNFVISLGPVLVLVFPKKAKKLDRTGLLNTSQPELEMPYFL